MSVVTFSNLPQLAMQMKRLNLEPITLEGTDGWLKCTVFTVANGKAVRWQECNMFYLQMY